MSVKFTRKFQTITTAIALLFLLSSFPVSGQEQEKPDPNRPHYDSAILMEAESGQVLFEYKPDKKHIPASLVKMMVMLLAVEAIDQGVFTVDQQVHVSREASKIGGSQVYLKQGEVFSLGDLLKAVVIASGNDAAYAIAEHIAGTPEGMVQLMNKRARELGMTQTTYTNVHGLPPSKGQEQDYTSARDIAILAREIVKHPLLLEWGGTYKDTFRNGKFTLWNTNKLLRTFRGMDGIKTGYYAKAGYNLCATAKRDGLRLISVVLGAPKQKDRVRETRRLLMQGYRVYKKVTYFDNGKPVGKPVPISQGKKKTTTVTTANPLTVLVKRLNEPKVKTRITLSENPLPAPVKKGQEVGKAELVLGDKVLASTPLLADEDVAKKSWLDRLQFWKK